MSTMSDLSTKAQTVYRTLMADLAAARTYRDDTLTPEALHAGRQKLAADARDRAEAAMATVQANAQQESDRLLKVVAALWPTVSPDVLAAKAAQAQHLLDAGMPLAGVINAATDVETLAAIREWGPTWLQAAAFKANPSALTRPDVAPAVADLNEALDRRLAIIGDDRTRAALADRSAAEADLASLQTYAGETNHLTKQVVDLLNAPAAQPAAAFQVDLTARSRSEQLATAL